MTGPPVLTPSGSGRPAASCPVGGGLLDSSHNNKFTGVSLLGASQINAEIVLAGNEKRSGSVAVGEQSGGASCGGVM